MPRPRSPRARRVRRAGSTHEPREGSYASAKVTLDDPLAILITGPYGSGKSSLASEIAEVVEGELPYAAIDMDWLAWFNTGMATTVTRWVRWSCATCRMSCTTTSMSTRFRFD